MVASVSKDPASPISWQKKCWYLSNHVPEHSNLDIIMRILNVTYVFMCSFVTSEGCVCNCAASLRLLSGFFFLI